MALFIYFGEVKVGSVDKIEIRFTKKRFQANTHHGNPES